MRSFHCSFKDSEGVPDPFKDLTLDQLIKAIQGTPNLLILVMLQKEFDRFPNKKSRLEEMYNQGYKKWNADGTKLRANFGKCNIFWLAGIPYLQCEWSYLVKNYVLKREFDEKYKTKINWIKKTFVDPKDLC
jgi:hypothetical protein